MSARTLLVVALVAGAHRSRQVPTRTRCLPAPSRRPRRRRIRSQPDQDLTTTLDDQPELSLTVYNSDIALVRDVRNLQLARGTGNLRFMDIAATVNPATVHFRSLTEPSQVERARAELRIRPARSRQAAAQVRRPRSDADAQSPGGRHDAAGRSEGDAAQLQHQPGVEDRQRDRHRHRRRSHPLPRAARFALLTTDADLDGAERRRGEASRRSVVSRAAAWRGTPTTC